MWGGLGDNAVILVMLEEILSSELNCLVECDVQKWSMQAAGLIYSYLFKTFTPAPFPRLEYSTYLSAYLLPQHLLSIWEVAVCHVLSSGARLTPTASYLAACSGSHWHECVEGASNSTYAAQHSCGI